MAKSVTRYFLATDGVVTVFRASPTRVYLSAYFERHLSVPSGDQRVTAISFSATFRRARYQGYWPCTEITKTQYDRLVGLKYDRHHAAGLSGDAGSPQDSWVWNKALTQDDAA